MAEPADGFSFEGFVSPEDGPNFMQAQLMVPFVRADYVVRLRLEAMIEAGFARSTALHVFAPVGTGKTALVAAWAARQTRRRLAWLSLTPREADADCFLHLLAVVLGQLGGAPDLCRAGQDRDGRLCELANATFAMQGEACLVIDNVDQVMSGTARLALERFLGSVAPCMRFVLIGRALMDCAEGRNRVYGQSLVIGADDLRFSDAEARAILDPNDGLLARDVARLNLVVEGWAAGLQLARSLLADGEKIDDVVSQMSGNRRDLIRFFRQEIMETASADDQNFMMKTSLLGDFSAEQCEKIVGIEGVGHFIDRNISAGRFLNPRSSLDGEYGYLRIFGQFLEAEARRVLGDECQKIHLSAVDWHRPRGEIVRAFGHALKAGQADRAAAMLEDQCDHLFILGRQQTVMMLAAQLPIEVRNRYPRIILCIVWRYIAAWKLDQAEELLSIARELVSKIEKSGNFAPDQLADCKKNILHREMVLALYRDDVVQAEDCANILLNGTFNIHPYVKGSIYHCLLEAGRMQFKVRRVDRIAMIAREQTLLADSPHAMVFNSATVAWCYYAAGRTDEAISEAAEGIARGERLSGLEHTRSLASVAAMALAAFRYECNDIADAQALIDAYYEPALELGMIDQLVAAKITRPKLLWLHREHEEAISALEQARHFAMSKGFERLKSAAEGELVRLLLKLGRLEDAKRIGNDPRMIRSTASVMPSKGMTMRAGEQAMLATRLFMAQGNIADALAVIRHWRRLLYPMGVIPIELKWDVLLAEAMVLDGDRRGALRLLDRSIAIATPAHLQRVFLDEGPIIADLIDELCRKGRDVHANGPDMREQLLAAFCNEQGYKPLGSAEEVDDSGLQGAMSRRELQVLNLVAQRMSNREIGDQLGLTEGSVKWYLQQIYDKFGVRRRLDVARKARQLGLVSEAMH